MSEANVYSKGANAVVRKMTTEEETWFSEAQLVREEVCGDPYFFKTNYYRHRVGNILFPGLFPEVVGARRFVHTPSKTGEFLGQKIVQHARYINQLFSRKADVPEDHATYCLHMQMEKTGKHSLCACDTCKRHRIFHATEDLEPRAYALDQKMNKIGIDLPWHDSTDYCLSPKGLIFFETERFSWSQILESLEVMDLDEEQKNRARPILGRIHVLQNASRDAHLRNESESMWC